MWTNVVGHHLLCLHLHLLLVLICHLVEPQLLPAHQQVVNRSRPSFTCPSLSSTVMRTCDWTPGTERTLPDAAACAPLCMSAQRGWMLTTKSLASSKLVNQLFLSGPEQRRRMQSSFPWMCQPHQPQQLEASPHLCQLSKKINFEKVSIFWRNKVVHKSQFMHITWCLEVYSRRYEEDVQRRH